MYQQKQATKRQVDLHELGARRLYASESSPLLFVRDTCYNIEFLIDTGAVYSFLPLWAVDASLLQPVSGHTISTIGGGSVLIEGQLKTQINLGFSQLFEFDFYAAKLPYGILGANFLRRFNLCIDLTAGRLFQPPKIEKFSLPIEEGIETDFTVQSSQQSSSSLLQHLKSHYPQVFNASTRSREIKHSITAHVETTTEVPVWSRARRLAPDKFVALKQEVKYLVNRGILAESQSAWASPIVMVKKPSGKYRLCADFVALNKILKVTRYALPNINDFSSMAHGCSWFSSMDIKDAYYHIPVDPADSHKLTITTPLGNYKYLYLPMGLATSSGYFQKLMNEVLSGLPRVFVYLDDIIIMSPDLDDHRKLLSLVFERLKQHGLVVNDAKCVFAVKELSFLGHLVSAEGVKPTTKNVKAITDYVRPRTKRQLRRFLGMIQFYCRFIPDCAEILSPLYSLLSSGARMTHLLWSPETENCFLKAKQAVEKATVLAHPNHEANLELVTDASDSAVGAVLQQVSNGLRQPLVFWSKALTHSQRSWSCFERELFACYAAIKHFQYFLEGRDFLLKTDHKPIVRKFQHNSPAASPRQARFIDYILQFTSRVEHVSGRENVADVLSRPLEPPLLNLITPPSAPLDYLQLAVAQRTDPEITDLRRNNSTALVLKDIPLAEHGINILCDVSTGRLRPVIPISLRASVFKRFHSLAHPGIRGSIALLTEKVVWIGIKKHVAQWTRECLQCNRSKIQRHNRAPLEAVTPPPNERFTHVYVDITGPLPLSKGYSYLLVIIDRYSRFMQAVPLQGISAEECSSAFVQSWVSLFGTPSHIYCDRGAQFTSALWRKLALFLGAQLHHSTAYHPQAQGLVERVNRTLKTALKCAESPTDWYDNLPWALLSLRNQPKEDLDNHSPNDFVFGGKLRLPGEFFVAQEREDKTFPTREFVKSLAQRVASFRYHPPRKTNRSSHLDSALFNPQVTHVFVKDDVRRHSLQPAYRGPYLILERCRKFFVLDYGTHHDRVSIDRIKPAIFSMTSLNQESENACPLTANLDKESIHSLSLRSEMFDDLDDTCSPTPSERHAEQHTLHDNLHSNSTRNKHTSKGRPINAPKRFRDYEML